MVFNMVFNSVYHGYFLYHQISTVNVYPAGIQCYRTYFNFVWFFKIVFTFIYFLIKGLRSTWTLDGLLSDFRCWLNSNILVSLEGILSVQKSHGVFYETQEIHESLFFILSRCRPIKKIKIPNMTKKNNKNPEHVLTLFLLKMQIIFSLQNDTTVLYVVFWNIGKIYIHCLTYKILRTIVGLILSSFCQSSFSDGQLIKGFSFIKGLTFDIL